MTNHSVQVIGDEVWYGDQLVAILAQSSFTPTLMDSFIHGLENATLFEDGESPSPEAQCLKIGCTHLKECPKHDPEVGTQRPSEEGQDHEDRNALLKHMERVGKNGLLRVQDACTVINQYFDGEI